MCRREINQKRKIKDEIDKEAEQEVEVGVETEINTKGMLSQGNFTLPTFDCKSHFNNF